MNTPNPWGGSYSLPEEDYRKTIYASTNLDNTLYIGGDFQYIGPNTGAGVIMNEDATQVLTYKKWRINGPVYTSVPDGSGGYYIGGLFTKIGDSLRNNIAHINSNGVPTDWKPIVNDFVKAMVIYNDTLIIGGRFTSVNGQSRNAFARLNRFTASVLPSTAVNIALKPGTLIHAFKLVDTFLYVGAKYNIYNLVGSAFKVFLKTGGAGNLPVTYQMEDVYTIEVTDSKRKVYIGGHAGGGGDANGNGFCMDANTGALLYRVDVGVQNISGRGAIYSFKTHGGLVYAGGNFNFGFINGNAFNQKGLVVFDTATGQIRNFLNNCQGFVTSIHAKGNKIYLGGEYNSVGGVTRYNFSVFDTTLLSVATNTLSISDQIKTISFTGTNMFIGGFFQSIDCVPRNGFAAFDMNTGQISSWAPNLYANLLTDMEAKGDTVFLSGNFGQVGNQFSLGGFVAVNGTSGTFYTNTVRLAGNGYDMLMDGDFLYISGVVGSYGNNYLVKVYIPSLNEIGSWKPNPGFHIKSIQKRNGKIYGVGDLHAVNYQKGFLTEINDSAGLVVRTIDLNPAPNSPNDFNWVNAGALAGNKFFFSGNFTRATNLPRGNFAVFDIDKWEVTPINILVSASTSLSDLHFKDGNIYFSGSFETLNNKYHPLFAVIDTTVGAIFPDRLHFNDDSPFGYSLDDYPSYERLNSFLFANNHLIAAGNFRNVNKGMFPSLAKLQLTPGVAPTIPLGISGPDTIPSPSQNNLYTILNPVPANRYAWFTSGQDVTIRNNGTDSIRIDVGPLAIPGVLKVIALTECGRSDTIYRTLHLNTIEPTVNSANLVLVRKTDTTATIRFTRGNGAKRIVVIRAVNNIVDVPQDHQEYIANNNFGAGANLGNNSYVIYNGNGDSVAIKQLSAGTVYYVTVFEFNGLGTNTNYLVTGNPSLNFITLATQPSIPASNIVVTNVTQTSLTISCTPGNGTGRLIVMRIYTYPQTSPIDSTVYTASTIFGSGSNLGSENFVVSNSTSPVTITNLQPNNFYVITVFEHNGTGKSTNYLTTSVPSVSVRTMATEPTVQASNIVISNIGAYTCTINCTPGNGTYRLVVMRKASAVTFIPQDSIWYGWGSSNAAFGFGTDLGGNTYVLNSSTPVYVSNLAPNTVYHISIFEFNGSLWNNNYLVTSPPIASLTTGDNLPTVQASNILVTSITTSSATLNCTSGNGSNRLFVIRAGSPVIDNPVDGVNYPASTFFGTGSNIGNNSYVLGYQQPVYIHNLSPATMYYIKVFEFNGTGTTSQYLIAGAPSMNFITAGGPTPEPTVQATNITASSISPSSATINCTPGNGQNRLVVIRQSSNLSSSPADGTPYTANTVFGNGSNIGNQNFVISVNTTPVTVNGLLPETEYSITVFEFNGSGSQTNYLTTGNQTLTFRTLASEPTQQAINITYSSLSATSVTINCTIGNGQNRLVIIQRDSSLSSAPVDGVAYNASTTFGTGSDIGNQTFVISSTGTPVMVTGLNPETNYAVSIFEFNGVSSQINYLTTSNPIVVLRTLAAEPTTASTNIVITNISSSSATVNFTAGNGQGRIVLVRQGTNITASPADGLNYIGNTVFGNGDNIGDQTYVLSNTSSPVTVTGLQPQTDYTIKVFEYNGSGNTSNYLLSNPPTSTFRTAIVTGIINLGIPETSLQMFPNPVFNEKLDIIFKSPKRGNLSINIYSISGAHLLSKTFQIRNNLSNLNIQLPGDMLKGPVIIKFTFLGKETSVIAVKI